MTLDILAQVVFKSFVIFSVIEHARSGNLLNSLYTYMPIYTTSFHSPATPDGNFARISLPYSSYDISQIQSAEKRAEVIFDIVIASEINTERHGWTLEKVE
uniref:Uncharacterized protein n=1 Tax=Coccidioides posadasii RMSCC 3488 TaxID=454284 RepID=A0A0J6IB37_COCPO|nr:hypothetical protein CPAG_05181 [Coccidioides posadasii RMSCC 3488]